MTAATNLWKLMKNPSQALIRAEDANVLDELQNAFGGDGTPVSTAKCHKVGILALAKRQ